MTQPIEYLPNDPDDPSNPGGTPGGTPASNYGTVVFDKDFAKLDAGSALDITCYLNCYNQDDLKFSVYVFVDENLVQTGTTNAVFDNSNSKAQQTMTVVTIVEGMAAGQHDCRVRVKNRETEGPLVVQPGSILKLTELRQGGR